MAEFQKIGATQRAILEALREADDMLLAFLTSGASSRGFFKKLREIRGERYQDAIQKSLEALKRRRLVHIVEKDGEHHITLTRDGKETILAYRFHDMKLPRDKAWDGKWRVVIFDIPEKYAKARRSLAYKMRQIGAMRLQDSVYIYPFPWRDEIDFISEFFQVSHYVRYLEVLNVEGEEELRRMFQSIL